MRQDEPRDLTSEEREAVISEHLEWLGGLMPSEAIKRDAHQRLSALTVFAAKRCAAIAHTRTRRRRE